MSVGTSDTAVSAGGTNVLALLDQRAPTSFYWSLTLLATIGGFLFGYDTANIGSALPFIPYPLGGFALGYLVAGASLGAAVGALAAGRLADELGRKSLLIVDALIYALGALLSAFTPNAAILLIARTLIGLAIGADSAIATAYIAEYAPRGRRGALSILQQWMITVGILAAFLVALVILWALPHSARTLDWRLILGVGAVPALVGVALRTTMPESPRWLLRHGRFEDAKRALAKLGIQVSIGDIRFTASQLQAADERARRERRRIWSAGVQRALIVVCVFFIFQQISGINVPLYYGPKLLGPLFQSGGSRVAATIAGVEVTAIIAAVNVIATYFAFRWIDRLGRRKISMGGYAGMCVAATLAATGLLALHGTARIEVFPTCETSIGLGWIMFCFAGIALMAIGFIHQFLPETKNRSVEEITQLFERQAAGDRQAGLTSPRSGDAAAA